MRTKPPIKKPWSPTRAQRDQIEMMVAVGVAIKDIAVAIGVTQPTLRKHCRGELDNGLARKRGEIIGLLWKSARGGNVSAQKQIAQMVESAAAEASFVPTAEEPKPRALGKKEEALLAAQTAGQGTDWAADLGLDERRPN